jgi:hypothetical protein
MSAGSNNSSCTLFTKLRSTVGCRSSESRQQPIQLLLIGPPHSLPATLNRTPPLNTQPASVSTRQRPAAGWSKQLHGSTEQCSFGLRINLRLQLQSF